MSEPKFQLGFAEAIIDNMLEDGELQRDRCDSLRVELRLAAAEIGQLGARVADLEKKLAGGFVEYIEGRLEDKRDEIRDLDAALAQARIIAHNLDAELLATRLTVVDLEAQLAAERQR